MTSTATTCPDYEGVTEFGGPCWTCQNGRGPCPLDDEQFTPPPYDPDIFKGKVRRASENGSSSPARPDERT